MLQSLSIRNVILIDKLDIDFQSGLSVLTGETGAGKSILLDSLGLVLGNRAETGLIRYGAEKLAVGAIFSLSSEVKKLLEENEIEADQDLIIKRVLSRDGKGKIFINDQAISAKLLKDVGRLLVEVHGQFDNHGLLNPANHLDVLDSYGDYCPLLLDVRTAFLQYKSAKAERIKAESGIAKSKEDEENLRHWVKELEAAKPTKGEEEELAKRRLELMNAEKIIESLNYAYQALSVGSDIQGAIRQAQSAVDKANRNVDGKYDEIVATLDRALIEAVEAISQIETASENVSLDGQELENIESRLFMLKGLARKHQTSVDDLADVLETFRTQLDNIELGEEGLELLRQKEQETRLCFLKSANLLSEQRALAAKKLDAGVMAELPPLKMEKAKFLTIIDRQDEPSWNEKGFDNVYFTVATNPNSPQGPINKIASGGELARFMLALKVNLATSSSVGTMIFDEVDSGVGGATAQAVGDRLGRLAKDVQVLVVTHSPQVASRGKTHFKVEKFTKDNVTTTNVRELSVVEKHEEVARMLAGEVISDEARAAAKVLIGQ